MSLLSLLCPKLIGDIKFWFLNELYQILQCINKVNIAQILEPNCDLDAQKIKGWARPKLSKWDPSILNEDSLELLSASQQHSGRWCRVNPIPLTRMHSGKAY